MKKVIDAIKAINPNAEVVIRGDSVDDCEIQWLEKTSEISKEDIKSKMSSMEYIYKREEEYPSLKDQLDMIYHAGQGGDGFQKAIKAVKDKYPKC